MKTKSFFRNVLGRFAFAIAALMLCSVAFFATSCGGDDPVEPTPVVDGLVRKNIELVNRVKANEAGKAKFTDQTKVIGTLTVKTGDKTENKDVTKENTFTAEASWSAGAITISALAGEVAKRPTITFVNNGLTFDFGAFKSEKAVTIANSSFTFTESGKSFTVSDYGFMGGSASADVVKATSTVQKGGKNYSVQTFTVKFKVNHSDGSATDEQTITFQKEDEVTGPPTLVSYEVLPDKFEAKGYRDYLGDFISYTFVVRRNYSYGAPSDTTFTYAFLPKPSFTGGAGYKFRVEDINNRVFNFQAFMDIVSTLSASTQETKHLKVDTYKETSGLKFSNQTSDEFAPFEFFFPKVVKYSEKGLPAIDLPVPTPVKAFEKAEYQKVSGGAWLYTYVSVSFGSAKVTVNGRSSCGG